jgi:ribonuclease HII
MPDKTKGPTFKLEQAYIGRVCGLDEVGRGPLAGPVVAACVYIPIKAKRHLKGVNDSKQISIAERQRLSAVILDCCEWGMGEASVAEIDAINILRASHLAMQRAYDSFAAKHQDEIVMALVDGRDRVTLPCPVTPVIGGDGMSLSIAAASIIAKVARDAQMVRLHDEYPHYGWNTNAGYGVKAHYAGIRIHGVTPHHRTSFAPVREALSA